MIAPTRRSVRRVLVVCIALSVALLGAGLALADPPAPAKKDDAKAPAKSAATADAKAPAGADEKPAVSPFLAATRRPDAKPGDVVVITNDDLDRLSGGGVYVVTPAVRPGSEDDETAPDGTAAEAEDPLEWMARRQAEAGENAGSRAEAEQRVAELEKRVADLERRRLAIRNPLLAPPEAPSPDETEPGEPAWDELDARQRVERTEAELARARAELAAAREALGGE